MKKFAIGYQIPENGEPFSNIVADYIDSIQEVYFAWPGLPSGRIPFIGSIHENSPGSFDFFKEDLCQIKKLGVELDLLFNATCYGRIAVNQELQKMVLSVIEQVINITGSLEIVTTSSIAIASIIKKYYPEIECRASVNMRIPFAESMSYISHLFDSFHIQRDFQRNLNHLKRTKEWCTQNKKKLCLLVNSGCLFCCPGQLFHDNLVAHHQDILTTQPLEDLNPHLCWQLFQDSRRWSAILKGSWIRPEDLVCYEELVDIIKLATRIHSNPRMVIHAYTSRTYSGNLLDLFEPTFSVAFAPKIINNQRFPSNWFHTVSTCERVCHQCLYCDTIFPSLLDTFPLA